MSELRSRRAGRVQQLILDFLPHRQYQETRSPALATSPTATTTSTAAGAVSPYTSIRDVVARTYRGEGLKAFYKGLAPNLVRILPGTCVTFVVYENLSVSAMTQLERPLLTCQRAAADSADNVVIRCETGPPAEKCGLARLQATKRRASYFDRASLRRPRRPSLIDSQALLHPTIRNHTHSFNALYSKTRPRSHVKPACRTRPQQAYSFIYSRALLHT